MDNSKREPTVEIARGASKISGGIIEATVEFQLENIFDKYSHHESHTIVMSDKNERYKKGD